MHTRSTLKVLVALSLFIPAMASAGSQTFNSSGTFTVPAFTSLTVYVYGAGGGGGGGGGTSFRGGSSGGPGGVGGYSAFNNVVGYGGGGGDGGPVVEWGIGVAGNPGADGSASEGDGNYTGGGASGGAGAGIADVWCDDQNCYQTAPGAPGGKGGLAVKTYNSGELGVSSGVSVIVGVGGTPGSQGAQGGQAESGAGGSVTITWTDAPSSEGTCSVTFDQNPISRGDTTTMRWFSTGDPSLFYINSAGYVGASGSAQVGPNNTTDYTGHVSGPGGTNNCPATLVVSGTIPPGTPPPIPPGTPPLPQPPLCTPRLYCNGNDLYSINSSCVSAFRQRCSWQCSTNGCVPPPSPGFEEFDATYRGSLFRATGHLQVRPTLVRQGDPVQVYWKAKNVSGCSITGTNADSWTDLFSGAAGKTSGPIPSQTQFTLNCLALPGAIPSEISEHATVNVIPAFKEL